MLNLIKSVISEIIIDAKYGLDVIWLDHLHAKLSENDLKILYECVTLVLFFRLQHTLQNIKEIYKDHPEHYFPLPFFNRFSNFFPTELSLNVGSQKFKNLNLANLTLKGGFFQSELMGANFSGAKFENFIFEDCDLTGADFSRASFTNCTFKNCNLRGAKFSASNIKDCSFIKTNLINTSFNEANIDRVRFANIVSLDGLDLSGASMDLTLFDYFSQMIEFINKNDNPPSREAIIKWFEKDLDNFDRSQFGNEKSKLAFRNVALNSILKLDDIDLLTTAYQHPYFSSIAPQPATFADLLTNFFVKSSPLDTKTESQQLIQKKIDEIKITNTITLPDTVYQESSSRM